MKIERAWSMLKRNTFDIPPIRQFINKHLVRGIIIDPFANKNRIATITNDLDPRYQTDYNMDALKFLKIFNNNSIDMVLYDPPYSPKQVSECYTNLGMTVNMQTTQSSYWSNQKKEISRIVKPGGKVITFGWNSGGIGRKYGFEIEEILLVAHGGWYNDTICTLERKLKKDENVIPIHNGIIQLINNTNNN